MRSHLVLFFLLIGLALTAQDNALLLNVFVDCQTRCNMTYIRQEVTFIDYQRERQGADVYVLVTSQSASAGAREMQMIFVYDGLENLEDDTILYYREANISDLEELQLFERNLKKGLLPAILQTELADEIEYSLEVPEEEKISGEVLDPWDYWSFTVNMNLRLNGESRFSEQGFFGRLNANRVTEEHKIIFSTWYDLDKSKFTLDDGEVVESENKRYRFFGQYVKSISDHWSAGIRTFVGSSTFGNTDFEGLLTPGIEYNVFPYSENSTKRFTFFYSTGLIYRNYMAPTIFDKLEESLWRQSLDVEYSLTKRWGDISFDIEFDQFLKDLSLYSISFNPNVELNLVRGLRLEFGGFISFVGDRVNISKEEISAQDIILQNRQLDTDYSYFTYMGFSYRFGSRNNNIVNPRF